MIALFVCLCLFILIFCTYSLKIDTYADETFYLPPAKLGASKRSPFHVAVDGCSHNNDHAIVLRTTEWSVDVYVYKLRAEGVHRVAGPIVFWWRVGSEPLYGVTDAALLCNDGDIWVVWVDFYLGEEVTLRNVVLTFDELLAHDTTQMPLHYLVFIPVLIGRIVVAPHPRDPDIIAVAMTSETKGTVYTVVVCKSVLLCGSDSPHSLFTAPLISGGMLNAELLVNAIQWEDLDDFVLLVSYRTSLGGIASLVTFESPFAPFLFENVFDVTTTLGLGSLETGFVHSCCMHANSKTDMQIACLASSGIMEFYVQYPMPQKPTLTELPAFLFQGADGIELSCAGIDGGLVVALYSEPAAYFVHLNTNNVPPVATVEPMLLKPAAERTEDNHVRLGASLSGKQNPVALAIVHVPDACESDVDDTCENWIHFAYINKPIFGFSSRFEASPGTITNTVTKAGAGTLPITQVQSTLSEKGSIVVPTFTHMSSSTVSRADATVSAAQQRDDSAADLTVIVAAVSAGVVVLVLCVAVFVLIGARRRRDSNLRASSNVPLSTYGGVAGGVASTPHARSRRVTRTMTTTRRSRATSIVHDRYARPGPVGRSRTGTVQQQTVRAAPPNYASVPNYADIPPQAQHSEYIRAPAPSDPSFVYSSTNVVPRDNYVLAPVPSVELMRDVKVSK